MTHSQPPSRVLARPDILILPIAIVCDTHYSARHDLRRDPLGDPAGAATRHGRARLPPAAPGARLRLRAAGRAARSRLQRGRQHALPAPAAPGNPGDAGQRVGHAARRVRGSSIGSARTASASPPSSSPTGRASMPRSAASTTEIPREHPDRPLRLGRRPRRPRVPAHRAGARDPGHGRRRDRRANGERRPRAGRCRRTRRPDRARRPGGPRGPLHGPDPVPHRARVLPRLEAAAADAAAGRRPDRDDRRAWPPSRSPATRASATSIGAGVTAASPWRIQIVFWFTLVFAVLERTGDKPWSRGHAVDARISCRRCRSPVVSASPRSRCPRSASCSRACSSCGSRSRRRSSSTASPTRVRPRPVVVLAALVPRRHRPRARVHRRPVRAPAAGPGRSRSPTPCSPRPSRSRRCG